MDNGGEFVSRARDAWAYAHDVLECWTSSTSLPIADAKETIEAWRLDYNQRRTNTKSNVNIR